MINYEESKRIASQRIMTLANDVLADFNGNKRIFEQYDNPYDNPEFKILDELEKKFISLNTASDSDEINLLRKFCIEFKFIPDRLYELMNKLDWLNADTGAPMPHLNGFYSSSFEDCKHSPRTTKTIYFCNVHRYIELLITDADLAYFYNGGKTTEINQNDRDGIAKNSDSPTTRSIYDCCFSNGIEYTSRNNRGFYKGLSKEQYYAGFTKRDYLLNEAIQRGHNLRLSGNLWAIYDDAINTCKLDNPIDPYEWLFKHATINDKLMVISREQNRILLLSGTRHIEYYDFIHGLGSYFERYGRPVT
ncbi:MAG: hypothetical protein E6Q33_02465 [Neisseriales bacterium]|nr:MAG: hypothetical protein E6Q33_02465 [Neisseriales bacterium]